MLLDESGVGGVEVREDTSGSYDEAFVQSLDIVSLEDLGVDIHEPVELPLHVLGAVQGVDEQEGHDSGAPAECDVFRDAVIGGGGGKASLPLVEETFSSVSSEALFTAFALILTLSSLLFITVY